MSLLLVLSAHHSSDCLGRRQFCVRELDALFKTWEYLSLVLSLIHLK